MKTLIQLRNEDFVRCCIDIFRNDCAMGAIRPLDTVIERALARQPLCHYLDYDSVSAKLHRIGRRGLEAEVKQPALPRHVAGTGRAGSRKPADAAVA